MDDLSPLIAASVNKNIYYLQQMGINIWQMRDIKPKRRILILVSSNYKQQKISKSAKNLLENMLASTAINRADFEVVFVDSATDIENIGFQKYTVVMLMGEDLFIDKRLEKQIHKSKLPLVTVLHPSHLLANPIDKKKAYLALCKLDFSYV